MSSGCYGWRTAAAAMPRPTVAESWRREPRGSAAARRNRRARRPPDRAPTAAPVESVRTHVAAVEHVELVGLAVLAERHLAQLPGFAGSRVRRIQENVTPPPSARGAQVHRRERLERHRRRPQASARPRSDRRDRGRPRRCEAASRGRASLSPRASGTTCSSSSTNGAPAGSGSAIAHSLPAWPRSSRDSS